jgi:c-di-GMP-binding flagellar brake protein YcgR
MSDQYIQNITDIKSILEMIRYVINSRIVSKMEFPRTQYSWITYFLDIVEAQKTPCLLVDDVEGFDTALKSNPQREVSFEFRDKERVPCFFKAGVIELQSQGILVEIPKILQRIQMRQYFRLEAPLGAEVEFSTSPGERETGRLSDLGGGGMAFLVSGGTPIGVGDIIKNIRLDLPEEDKNLSVEIPRAAVRRIEKGEGEKLLIAVEFTEIEKGVRKKIVTYVFERQRSIIRKIGH